MSETTRDRVADSARFEMTKIIEKKEDGRILIYYSFVDSEGKPEEQSSSSEQRHV